MFGLRIMTNRQIRELVQDSALTSAHACRRLVEPRGLECEGDFGRGMKKAVAEIDRWIRDLKK